MEEPWVPDPAAEGERMRRRLAGVLRELQRRSDETYQLRAERDALAAECAALRGTAASYDRPGEAARYTTDRDKASAYDDLLAEYNALMATKTMRLLATPRRIYARFRRARR